MKLFVILLVLPFCTTKAQDVFSTEAIGEEDKFSLVSLKQNESLVLNTIFWGHNDTIKNKIRYYLSHDTINCKNFIDQENYVDSKECESYSHYPEFIKIGNNQFKVSGCKGDSLIFDNQKRIVEAYRFSSDAFTNNMIGFIFHYVNDTIILESVIQKENSQTSVYLYYLDSKHNLKSIKHGLVPKGQIDKNIDTTKIDFIKETRFNYNSTKKCIDNIQVLDINEGKEQLRTTQYFIYKNKRPVKSYLTSNITKKMEYEQVYEYEP